MREYLMKMNFFLLLHYIINHLALTIVLPWCVPTAYSWTELAQHWVQLHEGVFTHWQRSVIQEWVIVEEGQCTSSYYWEPAESCLGFGSAQHLAGWEPGGTQKALFLSVLSPWVDITSSAAAPGWTVDWLSALTVKRWGTSWAWYLHLHIFFYQSAVSPFHYLRAPEEHMLMQHKWLSKQKGHSECSFGSRKNLGFFLSSR